MAASTLVIAQRLAALGFSVIPLDHPLSPVAKDPKQVGKVPTIDSWKEFQQRHPTGEELTAWFSDGAMHNIGIVTGAISGIVAVDLDSAAALAWAVEHLSSTPMRDLTAKGQHWIYRHPPGHRIKNTVRVKTADGQIDIDVRGDGGYIVAPGSTHHTGHLYRAPERWPDTLQAVPMFDPLWFGDAVEQQPDVTPDPSFLASPSTVGEGQRNAHLTSLAGAIRHHGAQETVIFAALQEENRTRCNPPLEHAEVAGIAASVAGYPSAALSHEQRVQQELARRRASREAAQRIAAEERGVVPDPAFETLRERLARPRPTTSYRIEGWQTVGARVVLAAQYKAGKTTLTGNLIRSLVDGDPWLGHATVAPLAGQVLLLDFEMAAGQLDSWLDAQGIQSDDRVIVESMKGQVSAFNILDAAVRTRWAAWLRVRGVAYVILDCLRPVLDGLGLDEHSDAGRFLVAFDALLREAGVLEALIVHHMGHSGERSRGDSRLRDWPDAEWRLTRQDADDPASLRFITAYGRDVEVRESQLAFDAKTRHLSIVGGSRRDAKVLKALDAVLGVIDNAPEPLSGRRIKDRLKDTGLARDLVESAFKVGVEDGVLDRADGPSNSHLFSRAALSGVSCQRPGIPPERVPVPIGTGHPDTCASTHGVSGQPLAPAANDADDEVGHVRI